MDNFVKRTSYGEERYDRNRHKDRVDYDSCREPLIPAQLSQGDVAHVRHHARVKTKAAEIYPAISPPHRGINITPPFLARAGSTVR